MSAGRAQTQYNASQLSIFAGHNDEGGLSMAVWHSMRDKGLGILSQSFVHTTATLTAAGRTCQWEQSDSYSG